MGEKENNKQAKKESSGANSEKTLQARKALHASERYSYKSLANILLVVILITWGLRIKPEEYLTAENGLGYALGIIGGSMMLLLLLYPVRKKMMVGRYLGSVPGWFKFHMFCGVFGPIAVLYHANFSLGSLNSSVALISMIIVASSGLVGRYFYSRIHYGLYGKKATLAELNEIIEKEESDLASIFELLPETEAMLKRYHALANEKVSVLDSLKRFVVLGLKLRLASILLPFKIRKELVGGEKTKGWGKEQSKKNIKVLNRYIRSYIKTVIKTCEFSVYERLFSLWHILHFPLFLMLVISGFIHVLAVHMY